MRSRRLWFILLVIGGGYVVLNLLFVNAVTIVHHVTFEIAVRSAATGQPIPAAQVAMVWKDQTQYQAKREFGVTDRRGILTHELVIQEQPPWIFPKAGVFKFRRMYLQVQAPGYRSETVSVARECPSVRFSGPRLSKLSIALKPAA